MKADEWKGLALLILIGFFVFWPLLAMIVAAHGGPAWLPDLAGCRNC